MIASGEQLSGNISSSAGWNDLAGAGVNVTITREVSLFDFTTNTFSGHVAGRLTLTTDSGVLEGTLQGTVSGAFADPNDLIGSIYASSANVKWPVNGPGARASGMAIASFTADPDTGTFCGPLALNGIH